MAFLHHSGQEAAVHSNSGLILSAVAFLASSLVIAIREDIQDGGSASHAWLLSASSWPAGKH